MLLLESSPLSCEFAPSMNIITNIFEWLHVRFVTFAQGGRAIKQRRRNNSSGCTLAGFAGGQDAFYEKRALHIHNSERARRESGSGERDSLSLCRCRWRAEWWCGDAAAFRAPSLSSLQRLILYPRRSAHQSWIFNAMKIFMPAGNKF